MSDETDKLRNRMCAELRAKAKDERTANNDFVYHYTAVCFASMVRPMFDDLDSKYNAQDAFAELFSKGWDIDEAWLKKFCERVNQLSDGNVTLIKSDPKADNFPLIVKGQASYLKLVGRSRVIKVIIGPYNPPITMFEANEEAQRVSLHLKTRDRIQS